MAHTRKHYRKRGHLRFGRLYGVLSVILIIAAIIAGCLVFFRVAEINVEGNSRYTEEEIIETSGIEYGSNMYAFNKFKSIDALLMNLTYVEEVTIRRDLPSTINITITESAVAAAVQDEEGGCWWLINAEGKLLESVADPGDYMQVTGLVLSGPIEGNTVTVTEDCVLQLDALLQLLPAMEKRDLIADTQKIDLSSASTVTLQHNTRLAMRINLSSDYDYDMRVLATVMEEYVNVKWTEEDTGTLDMTYDDGLPHLIKNVS